MVFFFLSRSEIFSKKLSNLYLAVKKDYEGKKWCPVPPALCALKQPWPWAEPSLAAPRPAPIALLLPPDPALHLWQQYIAFSPASFAISLSPAYIHGVNGSQNVCAEVLCVQIRDKPAALPKPINPQVW